MIFKSPNHKIRWVKFMKSNRLLAAGLGLVLCFILFLTTKAIAAPNTYGITNTRHNLLVPYNSTMSGMVGLLYNNYGEVCVYCHTPHGAQNSSAPLWNRALPAGPYTPYSSSTIDTNVGQPDGVSLACLSCHDGTIAVDSIINAPGSGAAWGGPVAANHYALNQSTGAGSCLQCHSVLPNANFTVMAFGQDLRPQHPISMNYPTAAQDSGFIPLSQWSQSGRIAWFEETGNTRADDDELKLYGDGAAGYKVQCATCHNPHGTRIGSTDNLYPTFLRKSNSSSAICTTCHIK